MPRAGLLVDGRLIDDVDGPLWIGRAEDAAIRVDDPRVSRQHALVERLASGEWVVRDRSRNGIWVDGVRRTEQLIDAPVVLALGAVDGPTLRLAAAPAPTPAPAPRPVGPEVPGATALGRLTTVHALGGSTIVIGRSPDADVAIDDLRASRRHAAIDLRGGGAVIRDLGSQNGTFVNGSRIDGETPLVPDDLVGIAGITFRFTGTALEAFEARDAAWLLARDLGVILPDGRRLLDGVSFALPPSSLLAVAGPSGAGKTTLLQALNGVRPAQEGTVRYQGRDLYASLEEFRGRMGFVPQSDILHLQLTVRQALRYAAELRFPADVDAKTRNARVEEVMAELGLAERANVLIGRLSGGQRKRTSVAVELLTRPSLVFLDEPTSGLDPANEAILMDLLRDLARGGRTVVVVTHSLQSLDRADRLLLLAPGGHLAFYGPPAEADAYFATADVTEGGLGGAFRALEERRDTDWATHFAATGLYRTHVAGPIAQVLAADVHRASPSGARGRRRTPVLRQLATLVRRYVAVIASDRATVALLALQAPIFGALFVLLFKGNVLLTAYPIEAAILVWLLALGATWLGTSNAIREIVKELPIYEREHAIGLSAGAYVASKAVVLGVITGVQAMVMTVIAMSQQSLPPRATPGYDDLLRQLALANGTPIPQATFDGGGAVLGAPLPELVVGAVLTGLAAMAIALLVSAVMRAADRVATVLPVLLIVQTVVSAPLLTTPPPVLRELATITPANWGMAALASTVDLNALRAPFLIAQGAARDAAGLSTFNPATVERASWVHDPGTWAFAAGALVALTVLGLVGAWLALLGLDRLGRGGRTRALARARVGTRSP